MCKGLPEVLIISNIRSFRFLVYELNVSLSTFLSIKEDAILTQILFITAGSALPVSVQRRLFSAFTTEDTAHRNSDDY